MKKVLIFLVLNIFILYSGTAGGFQVSMHSQQNVGMGLTGTSLYTSSSSIFYNPGALSMQQDNFSFSLGASLLYSNVAYKGADPTLYKAQTDNPLNFPFYFYGSKRLGKRFVLGVGVYTPYGSSMRWEDGWNGRYIIQNTSLTTIFIQPTLSAKIGKKIGLGIGLIYALGNFEQNNALPVSSLSMPDGNVAMKGSARNWGFNAGILVRPVKKLSVGLNFRSAVKLVIKGGDAVFTVPVSLTDQFPASNRFNTTIPLPANINLGAHYEISEFWLITLQIDYTLWNIYDTTSIDFSKNTESLADQRIANNYKGNFAFRIGTQYIHKKLIYRAGAYVDIPPSDKNHINPQNPGMTQLGLSAGISICPLKYIGIDISYLFVYSFPRSGNFQPYEFAGTYKGITHIPGLGLSIKF